jgi:hypothetical protein
MVEVREGVGQSLVNNRETRLEAVELEAPNETYQNVEKVEEHLRFKSG